MEQIKYPYEDENGIRPTMGKLSDEEKIRGYKAIEESIKRTKLISERQKASGSKTFNLRDYEQ